MPWGPCNDPNINGTHPALLSGLRCNSDVQLPYRFPILPATHHKECPGECGMNTLKDLVRDAQVTQAAQAGYAADYQNKRLPIAVHEAKEMLKAQSDLAEELKDKKPGYVGARMSKRIITDCYARGVCRGAEAVRAKEPWPREACRKQVDFRKYNDKKLMDCPRWTVYGGRGRLPEAGYDEATVKFRQV